MSSHVQRASHTADRNVVKLPSLLLAAGALSIVAMGFAVGLAELWPLLHRQWTEINDYNHGYLMLGMAGWLSWHAWHAGPPRELAPDWWWLAPLLAVLAALLLMELVFLNVPRLYVLPLLLVTCCGLVFGRQAARRVLGPVLLLYFALPIWAGLDGPLQALTARVVSLLLGAASIPAFIEGNFVYLPAGAFEIAAGCSGLNYLIVGMSVSALYGMAFLHSWRARLLLFVIAVGLTLLANWLRVFIIIMVGHFSDMQHYLVGKHVTFGWVLFAVMLLPLMFSARWLEHRGGHRAVARALPLLPPVRPSILAAALLCAGLLLLPGAYGTVGARSVPEPLPLPEQSADGGIRLPPTLRWQPVFEGGKAERVAYLVHEQIIDVYRVVYPQQDRDARVIRFRHSFTDPDWRPTSRRLRQLVRDGGSFRVIEYHGYAAGREALIWAWYEAGGQPATTNTGLKLRELAALASGRRDAAAVAIASACYPDCAVAADRMHAFLLANAPLLSGAAAGGDVP